MSRNSGHINDFTSSIFSLIFTKSHKMNRLRSRIYYILTFFLSSVFFITGLMKLTDKISPVIHVTLKRNFITYSKYLPLFEPDPDTYRVIVGIIEMVCSVFILIGPSETIKKMANDILLLIMVGAFFTHAKIGDPASEIVPCMVLSFLLACRYFTASIFSNNQHVQPNITGEHDKNE